MKRPSGVFSRRSVFAFLAASAATALAGATSVRARQTDILGKPIPSSGEVIPVIGLGSWITFNVGRDRQALVACTEVMRAFFEAGGRMIDSSPMYGSSQATIGHGLEVLGRAGHVFATDKVWTNGAESGRRQIGDSQSLWKVPRFALLQVHNLRDWQRHFPTLIEMKKAGTVRYIGVTTSHGRRHEQLENIMKTQPLDFIQLTYNIAQRAAENCLMPLASERGIAVIANRPFGGGRLIRAVQRHDFPQWAREEGLPGWPAFLLKFIVSHPAVNCAIPATTNVQHVRENMMAAKGQLLSHEMRNRMVRYIEAL